MGLGGSTDTMEIGKVYKSMSSCPTCTGAPMSWALPFGMNGLVWTEEFTFAWVELPFVSKSLPLTSTSNATPVLLASGQNSLCPLDSSSTFFLQHSLDICTLDPLWVCCCCCFTVFPVSSPRMWGWGEWVLLRGTSNGGNSTDRNGSTGSLCKEESDLKGILK